MVEIHSHRLRLARKYLLIACRDVIDRLRPITHRLRNRKPSPTVGDSVHTDDATKLNVFIASASVVDRLWPIRAVFQTGWAITGTIERKSWQIYCCRQQLHEPTALNRRRQRELGSKLRVPWWVSTSWGGRRRTEQPLLEME